MQKYLVFFLLFFLPASLLYAQDSAVVARRGIIPGVEGCKIYEENAWWLPDAYVTNAICACQTLPDEEKANLIRETIQVRMLETPEAIKDSAKQMKVAFTNGVIGKRTYRKFIKRVLTPRIYADHLYAYELAGCPAEPSAYFFWKIASTRGVKNCRLIWFGIRYLGGSCYGHWGRW